MRKRFILGFVIILMGGVFMAFWVKGEDISSEPQKKVYHDSTRDDQIEVTLYKKIAHLSGKNFGALKLKSSGGNGEANYKNETNNLILQEKDGEVSIFIGEKNVFAGTFQADDSYKNAKALALTKNVWQWQNLVGRGDTFLRPVNSNIFNMSFNKDGKVLAATNCADLSGDYQLVGDKISITNLNVAKKFCDNPAGEIFTQSLKEVISLAFDKDNNLVLFLKNNSGSMSFGKK